jgi:hypothetical protein
MNGGAKKIYYIGLIAESVALPITVYIPYFRENGLILLGLLAFGFVSSLASGVYLLVKTRNPLYLLFCIGVSVWIVWPKF